MSNLLRVYPTAAAERWLLGLNPEPRRPPPARPDPARAGARAARRDRHRAGRLRSRDPLAGPALGPVGPARRTRRRAVVPAPVPGHRAPRRTRPATAACTSTEDAVVGGRRGARAVPRHRRPATRSCSRAWAAPLALAELELATPAPLLDLDDPAVLVRRGAAPVARSRPAAARVTQAYAARLFDAHPDAAGLRWWSTLEASWINVTLFDRAAPRARGPRACARSTRRRRGARRRPLPRARRVGWPA